MAVGDFLDEEFLKAFSELRWRPGCLTQFVSGFRKWALVAYLVLAIYLLSNPSPDQLVERSQAFDNHLGAEPTSALGPALAAALGMPEQSVDCFLQVPKARPSKLVFDKLLDRRGSARGDGDAAKNLLASGVSVEEAVAFFDSVELKVMKTLKMNSACGSPTRRKKAFQAVR